MRAFFVWLLSAFKRLDLSPKVELARYAVNRAIDVFVIGPACIVLLVALITWLSGASPLQTYAEGMADSGEMFRGAPAGYVYVVDAPASSFPPRPTITPPPTREALAALPRKLIPVSEWTAMQASALGSVYLVGVLLGIFIILPLRGYRFLMAPFASATRQAPPAA